MRKFPFLITFLQLPSKAVDRRSPGFCPARTARARWRLRFSAFAAKSGKIPYTTAIA